MRWMVILLVAGCGRLGFGDSTSADAHSESDAFVPLDYGSGCIVGLSFDEDTWTGATGEVIDSCPLHNNGTDFQGAARVDDTERGRVAQLPPVDGCILIPNSPNLHVTTGLTMSAWVYPTGLDTVNPFGVIAKRTDFTVDDVEYDFFIWTDNAVWVDLDTHVNRVHGMQPIANNAWQQITVVYDGTQPQATRISIYIDGVLDVQLASPDATLPPTDSTLSIGCLPQTPATDTQQALDGKLDAAAIWSYAFTPAQVSAWHAATIH